MKTLIKILADRARPHMTKPSKSADAPWFRLFERGLSWRRAEGKLYRLPHVMLFTILAAVAGANSYRNVHTFVDVHLPRLRKLSA